MPRHVAPLQEEMHLVWKTHWIWKHWAEDKEQRQQQEIAAQKSVQDEATVQMGDVHRAPKAEV